MTVRLLSRFLPATPALVLLGACATTRPPAPPPTASQSRVTGEHFGPARPTTAAREPTRPPSSGLYSASEALRDVLSGPWEYVDTGPWPSNSRTQACVFRNERVIVVNGYCTLSEAPASRIDVYSPERGHVRIYAEANGPISARRRDDYFTFMVESEPPPGPGTPVPPLSLTMSFDELYAYEQRRYEAYLPACYGGEQRSEPKQSCLKGLSGHEGAWARAHRGFLREPGAAWYHVVHKTRSLARHYGTEPQ